MVQSFSITGGLEILQVVEAVSREKGIKRERVMEALIAALESVGRKKYGQEQHIRAEVNEKSGEIMMFRERDIVEDVEDHVTQITLADAKEKQADVELGGTISDPLPPLDFGRVVSQSFKQVLMQKIREAEREKQFEDFKDRVGEIITGVVKRVEFGDYVIDFGKTETILPRNEVIPREMYKTGDRIRAYIVDVRRENRGPQIFLSRTHPDFLAQLFYQEVPEIYDGLVEIKAVARDPGSRAKVAVYSKDSSLDPVGACIGPRGSRVTAVYNELQGEKIDIMQWSNDLATYAVEALAAKTKDSQVEVSRIIIDEDRQLIEAVVPDEDLSLAIGRRGQNVRLASKLLGWNINVSSETEESERRSAEFVRVSKLFATALNVEEVIGQLLASEGFTELEEVAYIPAEDLLDVEGFDEGLVEELQKRAVSALNEQREKFEKELKDKGVDKALLDLPYFNEAIVMKLAENNVKTLDDLGDLASDEFRDLVPDSQLLNHEIDEVIMAARAHWFADEPNEDAADIVADPASETVQEVAQEA